MITDKEREVVNLLVEAWNKFFELPVMHTSDRDEFMRAIHAAQNIVLSRPTIRELDNEST